MARITLCCFVALTVVAVAQTPSPKDPAKELFESVCSGCHSLDRIKTQHLNKQQWRERTSAMIDQGAVLTPEETNLLLDYLVKSFGPEPEQ
ncbi:MAG: cytochrome c [Acidobacteriota bacterium]